MDASTNPFEPDILAFEAADRKNPPPHGEIVFVGSSTFTYWHETARDFPGFTIINRGFGGSELSDVLYYVHRIVTPYAPRQVVVYAGDNDIGGGKPPALVVRDFRRFVHEVHAVLPETLVSFVSIKPSALRLHLLDEIVETNQRIEQFVKLTPFTSYIDVFHVTLDEKGEIRSEMYIDDGLHLNRKGYRAWAPVMIPVLIPPKH